ncbi:hypothetical protein [Streptomyces sp. MP131-18]|uniref:hypothetical protein n=1 Tax=Streptomyces sp. MP131-18 TaxID=1857892 RepID=UPI0009CB1BC5|nr:hypothetical protein [Streptomyces sp. MP131-18]ONK09230.1 hypothetical protein STBA_71670 [Streptomyces sp. MP131-18]
MILRATGMYVTRPRTAAHRYDLLIDAVSTLDVDALYRLVCRYGATVDEVVAAARQTDRTPDELGEALAAWMAAGAGPGWCAHDEARLITTLTQPALPLELS